ncbi:MAG: carboxypeptidase regulatory-like domain-containing protein [Anaerolineae bacterium]|nr:carboxypeptidase regulatory-like domain-containing protein [Anaerolineae bacterium]
MSKPKGTGCWLCGLVGAIVLLSWVWSAPAAACQLPITSTFTPTYTPTPEYTDTPSPTPTHTFTPTPSDTPTDTPSPTPTDTPSPTSSYTPTPVTATPTRGATREPTPVPTDEPSPPQPNPSCQSTVQGVVLGQAGQPVAGATVIIRGDGWSSSIQSDDQGRFGFGGLCAGSATLQAVLPNGQSTGAVSVSLSGSNQLNVTLSVAPAPAAPSATAPGASTSSGTGPTPEPEMPTTGAGSWLLIGGAALGVLLLLSASVRRALVVRNRE